MDIESTLSRISRPRIALYSHDAVGLGHIRRNLAIASALRRMNPAPDLLLLTGTPEAAALDRPDGCDVVGLPSVSKDTEGTYRGRHLSLPMTALVRLRAETISAALAVFQPDLLIVDKHPRGFRGELTPALRILRGQAGTRTVLGLRDVLDEPRVAREQWRDDRSSAAVEQWYDEIWLYGDPRVHDATSTLPLTAQVARRVVHTGYLAARAGDPRPATGEPYVVGLVGGGDDGGPLAEAFSRARMPEGHHGVLVTGPHLPAAARAAVARYATGRGDLVVREFVTDPAPVLDDAAAVVSMGGYNTVCEVVARGHPLLVVPRVRPRAEQLVRARKLAACGVLDMLHPDALTPGRLTEWLAAAVRLDRPRPAPVDLDGLDRLPLLAADLLRRGRGRPEFEDQRVA